MADPISTAASVVSVLEIAAEVLRYVRGVASASKDSRKLVLEISSLRGVLETLRDTLDDASTSAWTSTLRSLSHSDGPLAILEKTLREILRKVSKLDRPSSRLDVVSHSISWPFKEREIESLLGTLERQKSLLSLAFDNDHIALSKAIHDDTQAILARMTVMEDAVQQQRAQYDEQQVRSQAREDEATAEKLAQWLSPINGYSKQSDLLRSRLEGTGTWLLETPEFESWITGRKRTLLCHGIPGSGKTLLSSMVVQHIQTLATDDVSNLGLGWIYCDYKQRNDQTLPNLLGSLIEQLIRSRAHRGHSGVWKEVEKINRDAPRSSGASMKDLLRILNDETRHFNRVYLIIDALDECDEEEGTRDGLLDAIQSLDPVVSLFLTSRDIPQIEESIEDPLRMPIQARQDDITKYIINRIASERYLRKHCQTDTKLQETILNILINSSKGMFLLTRLHMDLLERKAKRSKWAVREAISELPGSLDDTYGDALRRVENQHPEDVQLAFHALKWVYFAREPLKIKDFQYAMVIKPRDTNIRADFVDEPEYVVSTCAGMIQLDRDAQVIRPVHETAHAYLERQTEHFFEAHADIAAACLTYFLSDDFYQIPPQARHVDLITTKGLVVYQPRVRAFASQAPFAEYATTHVISHVKQTESEVLDLLIKLCMEGIDQDLPDKDTLLPGPKLTALLLSQGRESFSTGSVGNLGPLQFATFYQFHHLLAALLEAGIDPNTRDYNQHTALHVAIHVKNEKAIDMLLDGGADVNMASRVDGPQLVSTGHWSSPLSQARFLGNRQLSSLLTSKDAVHHDLDPREYTLGPRSSFQKMVQAIQRDTKGNLEPSSSSSSHLGSQEHVPELAKVLLDIRVWLGNSDFTGKGEESTTQQSTTQQYLSFLRPILRVPTIDYGTSVSRILYDLSETVVLSEHDASDLIDAEDEWGRRPTDWALDNGNAFVMKRLLDQGAHVNEFRMLEKVNSDRYSLSPGTVECFRIILEAWPSLKLDGADASTLFSLAAQHKNRELVRLLIRRESKFEGPSFISYSALVKIVDSDDMDAIKPILQRAADVPDTPDESLGPSMIWVASFLGHTKMVMALHDLGADINQRAHGFGIGLGTPLAAAASSGKLETVKYLVTIGARVNTMCSTVGTALDCSESLGRTEVSNYLIQQGAKRADIPGSTLSKQLYDRIFREVAAGTG